MSTLQTMPVEIREKYTFTEKEKQQIGAELSGKIDRLDGIEAEKKRTVSDFKEKIDTAESEIKRLATNINLGHEYRAYTCRIVRDIKQKMKKFYCVHSGKLIRTSPFERDDFQITFDDKARVKQPIAASKEVSSPKKQLDVEASIGQGIHIKEISGSKIHGGKGKEILISNMKLPKTKEGIKKENQKDLDKQGTKILKDAGLNKKAQPKETK